MTITDCVCASIDPEGHVTESETWRPTFPLVLNMVEHGIVPKDTELISGVIYWQNGARPPDARTLDSEIDSKEAHD